MATTKGSRKGLATEPCRHCMVAVAISSPPRPAAAWLALLRAFAPTEGCCPMHRSTLPAASHHQGIQVCIFIVLISAHAAAGGRGQQQSVSSGLPSPSAAARSRAVCRRCAPPASGYGVHSAPPSVQDSLQTAQTSPRPLPQLVQRQSHLFMLAWCAGWPSPPPAAARSNITTVYECMSA